jgi:hypothetical protein
MRGGLRFASSLVVVVWLSVSASAAELFPIYQRYVKAIDAGDLAAAKNLLSAGKLASLDGKSDAEALSALNVISPKNKLRAHQEIIEEGDATLIVVANVADMSSTGRIELAREDGRWKIVSEMWDLGGTPEETASSSGVRQPENDEQRAAIRKLREMGFASPGPGFLVMSAGDGNLEAVKLFLAAGYSPDTVDHGAPAIVRAAMSGHPEVVTYLIGAGANVNATDDVSTTALMRIAEKCDATETIRKLIEAGAKTDIKSAGGADAVQLAEWSGCAENVKAIRAGRKE